jgi:peroxiredoxin
MVRVFSSPAVCLLVAAGTTTLSSAGSEYYPILDSLAMVSASEEVETEAPEVPDGLKWVQGGPLKLADLRGRVCVIHFWTNGCVNCIHNYPVYRAWQEKYDARKVAIVGIHTPEFGWEAAAERVKKKAAENGLKFPIVLDPESKVWNAWHNRYWPSIYLVDKKGRVRRRWEGELHLDTEDGKRFALQIDDLLNERN